MSSDKSNIIPINRAIINKLENALKGMEQFCCKEKFVDAIFITFEGFMRSEYIKWDGRAVYEIPKYKPMKVAEAFDTAESMDFTIEKMTFLLDEHKTSRNLAVFKQVE